MVIPSFTLEQYPGVPTSGLPSVSPFCIKVEAYLQLRKLPYVDRRFFTARVSPTGRLPRLQIDGKGMTDSFHILGALENILPKSRLDRELSPEQGHQSILIQRFLDLEFYRILLFHRWVDDSGFFAVKASFSPLFPYGTGKLALRILRASLRKEARELGLYEWTPAQIYAQGERVLRALEGLLSEREFLFGAKPAVADCAMYAFLVSLAKVPSATPFYRAYLKISRLHQFVAAFERALAEPHLDALRVSQLPVSNVNIAKGVRSK